MVVQPSPSRASSSRTGVPPISKMTRPVGTLGNGRKSIRFEDYGRISRKPTALPNIQMYPFPFPYESHFPISELAKLS